MSFLLGSDVSDPNFVLRFAILVFMGVVAGGSVLFWRSELLFASEYQDLPVTHYELKIKKSNLQKQKTIQQKLIDTEE